MIHNGKFISFEGPDGSGKSTVAQMFYEYLLNRGQKVILTHEPGGKNNRTGELIRQIVLDSKDILINNKTEALLFAASRSQHVSDLIVPSINNGVIVICDRYIDSSLAYQGVARGLGIDKIYDINLFSTDGLLPDITFFIDIPVELGLERIKKNRTKSDRLDEETNDMHKLAYQGYQEIIKRWPNRFIIIDGTPSINDVLNDVIEKYNNIVGN